jgi:hypothetical protein
LLWVAVPAAVSEPIQTGPREPNLMPGQVIDGWTGLPIPCRCLYKGQAYKLGDVVCMSTPVGVVLTRCELFLNNTSWMPMPAHEPCTISDSGPSRPSWNVASLTRRGLRGAAALFCPTS